MHILKILALSSGGNQVGNYFNNHNNELIIIGKKKTHMNRWILITNEKIG